MSDRQLEITILVLSHNRLDELRQNLPLLAKYCEITASQLIVVDNASEPDVRKYISEVVSLHPLIHYIQNEINEGVAGGRNKGFAVARGKYIVAIDDDTHLPSEVIDLVPGLFMDNPEAGILAFRVRHPIRTNEWQNPHGEKKCYLANHHGAGCAIRREIFDKLGGIDPLCRFGSEEIDLCIRAQDLGYGVLYCPECVILHNSILQEKPVKTERMELRAYNNARVMHKHFSKNMARNVANRYLLSDLFHTLVAGDLALSIRLFRASMRGRRDGIRQHKQVSEETERFYNNPKLQPDFGNFPLYKKLAGKLKGIFS